MVEGSDDWIRENILPHLTRHRIKGKVLDKESELRAFIELKAEHYGHLYPDDAAEAVERLPGSFAPVGAKTASE